MEIYVQYNVPLHLNLCNNKCNVSVSNEIINLIIIPLTVATQLAMSQSRDAHCVWQEILSYDSYSENLKLIELCINYSFYNKRSSSLKPKQLSDNSLEFLSKKFNYNNEVILF